jgi:hypothetical protein
LAAPRGAGQTYDAVSDTPVAIAFEAAKSGLERQEQALDNLRSRAATLLAAASIATSFLGAQALNDPRGLKGLEDAEWVAVAGFVLLAVMAILVLLPWRGWVFGMNAMKLVRDYIDTNPPATLEGMQRDLALHLQAHYKTNKRRLECLYWAFRFGCVFLTVEVVAWRARNDPRPQRPGPPV